jgi:hypothetical protein
MAASRFARPDKPGSAVRVKAIDPFVDRLKQTLMGYLSACFGSKLFELASYGSPLKKKNFTFGSSPSEEARHAWEGTKEKWGIECPRILGHLHRLTRSDQLFLATKTTVVVQSEMDFGIAMLKHYHDASEKYDELVQGNVRQILAGESDQTTMFWTVAPYIYMHLTSRGFDDRRSVELIIAWSGKPADTKLEGTSVHLMLLDGCMVLSGFEGLVLRPFYLDTYNADDISHKVADKIAEHIVNCSNPFSPDSPNEKMR